MSSPFVAEIRIFGCNFAPTGWAQCNGQLMPISQNTALFSLLGTQYGGDGRSTFALPDLQGSVAMHTDQYSGGVQYPIGSIGGSQSVTLLQSEIPQHTHFLRAASDLADKGLPSPNTVIARSSGGGIYNTAANLVAMAPNSLAPAGSSLPHNNMQPSVTLNYCIALQGVFPQRP
jgi:microcystin-dependent protein